MSNVKSEGLFIGRIFITKLKEFIGQRVNVEFECASCCKRATNGTLVEVGKDFIQLSGMINVITFIPGVAKPVIKKASVVVIPLDRVCDVERP